MTDDQPVTCSLGTGDLQQRLAMIAELGKDALIAREIEDGRHVVRFRVDAETRCRLERIVAAEAECCPFLDLDLRQRGPQLVLAIAAPAEGQPLADELAAAFGPSRSGRAD